MNIISIIRNVLTLAGAFLLGRNLFGLEVNEVLWQEITGVIMIIAGIVMSVLEKSLTIEKLQGALRHIILAVGGILVAKGTIKPEQIEIYLGIAAALAPIIYGYLSRKKSQQVVAGEIPTTQLNQ
jgi:Ca2+/Na+ antiporter